MTEAIEKVTPGGALVLPEHLKGVHGQEGLEKMGREDLVLPRLIICQAMSPQRKKTSSNYIPELGDGDLFNTVTGQVYGNTAQVIPLLFSKSRIYFRELSAGGGILCQSFNGVDGGTISPTCAACPNSQFGGDGKPPACNVFFNYPAILLPAKEMLVVSFKSTALKAARAWNSRMKMMVLPAFAGVYEIRVVEQSNQKGTFFSPVVSFKRWTSVDEFNYAKEQFDALKSQTIRVEVEPSEEESVSF